MIELETDKKALKMGRLMKGYNPAGESGPSNEPDTIEAMLGEKKKEEKGRLFRTKKFEKFLDNANNGRLFGDVPEINITISIGK